MLFSCLGTRSLSSNKQDGGGGGGAPVPQARGSFKFLELSLTWGCAEILSIDPNVIPNM
jgi:hypothetical protein